MDSKPISFWPIALITAFIFQAIFFNISPGINYGIFTAIISLLIFYFHRSKPFSMPFMLLLGLNYITTFSVIFSNTTYSVFIYWIIALLLICTAGYSEIRHLQFIPDMLLRGFESLLSIPFYSQPKNKGNKTAAFIQFSIFPLIIIIVLLSIYASSNSQFAESLSWLTEFIKNIFSKISLGRVLLAFFGLVLALILIHNTPDIKILSADQNIQKMLIRVKKKLLNIKGLTRILLTKNRVAIVSFVILNLMIAWLNFLDIKHIWLNFSWDGGLLKSMVHEGTYLLIFAILISIGITLFYLRSNLVFLKDNRLFHLLIIAWLVQNIILAGSVWVRNTIYIEHFSLAYKRIFVYYFIIACVIGLVSIIYKIIYRRSLDHIISLNSISVISLLVLSAVFNWDRIIAKYNFEHSDKAFVHYDFLVDLNNSALPFLIKTDEEMDSIYVKQKALFPFVTEKEYVNINYSKKIAQKRAEFIQNWEHKHWLEWNYAEQKAYSSLK